MKNKNEEIKEIITNEINNNINENLKEVSLNYVSINKSNSNLSLNLQREIIKNRKLIKEIFKYSEESNEFILIFKENSDKNIKEFLNFFIQISNNEKEKKENLNEEEVKLICYNLRELKEIFLKSTEIFEQIQFNKDYYNEEYKEYGIIGILFNLYIIYLIKKFR